MMFVKKLIKFICCFVFFCVLNKTNGRPQGELEAIEDESLKTCGYDSCPIPKKDMLNVHIIAHTHDDVGWLKTVDQYYYGSKSLIQKAGVQYILDSVIQELLKDPKKKFIYVESAFFFKWWREQSSELQDQVKMLVNEGRLEFIGGAWSMNDEATTHYQSIIDQFSWGLRLLNDTFGECGRPRIGWQIDPFGHSREMASIFARMGYDGLFFGRLDYQDMNWRLKTQSTEMIWKASANLGESAYLFTGALFNQYQPPPGFCFDILCADEPIIDDRNSPDYNVERRVTEFLNFINVQRNYYRTNNIILTMGGDFTYMDANFYYKNLDKLIKYTNEFQQKNNSNIKLFYSTPSCYLKSLYDSNINNWPIKYDDFIPYGSDLHSYWTGYYTSRPTLKRFERIGNNLFQICKQLTTFKPKLLKNLNIMREIMGVLQHHDAITGTEKQNVTFDYEKQLFYGINQCEMNIEISLNYLKGIQTSFQSCHLLNISICNISEKYQNFSITIYNPLGQFTSEFIRLPVKEGYYLVDDYNAILESEIIPIPESIRHLHFRKSLTRYELIFPAYNIPPMGFKNFYIVRLRKGIHKTVPVSVPAPIPDFKDSSLIKIGNNHIQLTFDSNGYLTEINSNGISRLISQEFLYYESEFGNNRISQNRSSGAYIFRPINNTYHLIKQRPQIKVYKNSLVQEVHQKFNNWISQVIRVYRNDKFAEFEWLIGPIPICDKIGKEIVTRFNSNIQSNGIFYSDSNGREIIKRKRNHRDTWNIQLEEIISGNYYPITTKIAIEDDDARLTILVDRAQGGSSLHDGALELMIHRRLLHDDEFGVYEPLNEIQYHKGLITRGKHYLILNSSQRNKSPTSHAIERILQLKKHLQPWIFFYRPDQHISNLHYDNFGFSGLKDSLPKNIHLLTFEPWHENEILVRFEHIFEKDEDPEYSKSVKFSIKNLFSSFIIESIRETTLDGNQWLDNLNRMKFKSNLSEDNFKTFPYFDQSTFDFVSNYDNQDKEEDSFVIVMEPMQIRTFILTLEKKI